MTLDLDLLKMGLPWVAAVIAAAWLTAEIYYWRKCYKVEGRLNMGSIQVKGGFAEQLGERQSRLLLRAQISRIIRTFRKDRTGHSRLYTASVIGDRFKGMNTVLIFSGKDLQAPEITISEDWVIRLGIVEVPLGAMVKLFMILLRLGVPVPHRKRYMDTRINVSLVTIGDETQVVVFRGEGRAPAPLGPTPERQEHLSPESTVLAKTQTVKTLTDMDELIRTGAFMVLQLYGQAFPGRKAESMRYFVDGLDALDEYHRTRDDTHLRDSERLFGQAARIDAGNFPALYFHANLLLHKRSRASIASAQRAFERCLRTKSPHLKALVHTGLANCSIQGYHRLAVPDKDVLKRAEHHAREAERGWLDAGPDDEYEDRWRKHLGVDSPPELHPWITATLILVDLIGEGEADTREHDKRRFIRAAGRYSEAIEVEHNNAMLYNNLAWALLRLAELGIESITEEDGAPGLIQGSIGEKAEEYFHTALTLNPNNKLTHANLCLLYATPQFRDSPAREKYLRRSRFHGLKAVEIDPHYVNGFRDLTLSLLQYGQNEEAYEHFTTALRLAPVIEKDEEIIDAAVAIVKDSGASKLEVTRWLNPDEKLLEPPGMQIEDVMGK
jgi:tetratricopeptide (TPR) repeat protein